MTHRIMLIDDHQIVLDGLRYMLENQTHLTLVGTATDGLKGLALLLEHKPDLAIVDAQLPRMNGFDLIQEARRRGLDDTRFIMLSMHIEPSYIHQAIDAGVTGYVSKTEAATALMDAIDTVLRGETYISPEAREAFDRQGGFAGLDETDPIRRLTPRQRQVLQLLAEGKNPKEIGHMLGISNKTVHVFQRQIRERLNMDSVADMTRLAIKSGLIKS